MKFNFKLIFVINFFKAFSLSMIFVLFLELIHEIPEQK